MVGAIGVAKADHVAWFGTQWTQTSLAPSVVVSSQVYNWAPVLEQILTGIRGGKLGGGTYTITLANKGEKIAFNPSYRLPANVKTEAAKLVPISTGKLRVPR